MPKEAQNGFATKKNESQYKWHRNDNTDESSVKENRYL